MPTFIFGVRLNPRRVVALGLLIIGLYFVRQESVGAQHKVVLPPQHPHHLPGATLAGGHGKPPAPTPTPPPPWAITHLLKTCESVPITAANTAVLQAEGIEAGEMASAKFQDYELHNESVQEINFRFGYWKGALASALYHQGVETTISTVIKHVLMDKRPAVPDKIMVDVGMNAGWFTTLGAACGYHVHAFELQPVCIAGQLRTLAANNLQCHATLHFGGVATAAGQLKLIQAMECNGFYNLQDKGKNAKGETDYLATLMHDSRGAPNMALMQKRSAQLISLSDALLKEPLIKMLKIDIEGSEVNALRGARKLFENKRVENMVVEVSPGWWKRNGVTFPEGLLVFKELVDKFGFSAWALDGCGMPTSVCVPTSTKTPELVRGVIKDGRTGTHVTRIADFDAYLHELHTPKTRRSKAGHNVWFRHKATVGA